MMFSVLLFKRPTWQVFHAPVAVMLLVNDDVSFDERGSDKNKGPLRSLGHSNPIKRTWPQPAPNGVSPVQVKQERSANEALFNHL